MTFQELIFYCATTESGKRDIEKCYEKGRADAIDELVREAKEQYTMGEITYYDGTTDTVKYIGLALLEQIAEQLKEQSK